MVSERHLSPIYRQAGGFSYIEMLVCLVIIMILYAIMLSPSSSQVQAKRKAECGRQLQQIHMALTAYGMDHNGAYPSVPGAVSPSEPLSLLVPKYTSDTSIFICPGSGDSALAGGQPFANKRISYAYYTGLRSDAGAQAPLLSDWQINSNSKQKGAPLFATTKDDRVATNHKTYGGNVLFADGHLEASEGLAPVDMLVPAGGILLNPK